MVAACHGGGSDDPPAPVAQSYGASLTAIEITRVGDGQALTVDGLPVEGAELSVQ